MVPCRPQQHFLSTTHRQAADKMEDPYSIIAAHDPSRSDSPCRPFTQRLRIQLTLDQLPIMADGRIEAMNIFHSIADKSAFSNIKVVVMGLKSEK
jgi:hypothetical protein